MGLRNRWEHYAGRNRCYDIRQKFLIHQVLASRFSVPRFKKETSNRLEQHRVTGVSCSWQTLLEHLNERTTPSGWFLVMKICVQVWHVLIHGHSRWIKW